MPAHTTVSATGTLKVLPSTFVVVVVFIVIVMVFVSIIVVNVIVIFDGRHNSGPLCCECTEQCKWTNQ